MPAAPRPSAKADAEPGSAQPAGAGAAAIGLLKDEHLAIASVLFSLRVAVRRIGDGGTPDFRLLRALADYIVAFPERLHHPKEDRYLFAALAARCAEAKPLVAALEAEHAEGAARIAALVDALAGYAREGDAGFEAFAAAVESYVDFHWRHMAKEEDVLLPLAQRHLTAEDWERIAVAFRENDNPLSGLRPRDEADLLFRRILELVPSSAAARPTAPDP